MDDTSLSEVPLEDSKFRDFPHLASTFPEDFGFHAKEIGIVLISILLSGVSVIPNFKFGSAFGQHFAKNLAPHLNQTVLDGIKEYSAIVSGVANGYINARSVNKTILEIQDKVGNIIKVRHEKVRLFIGVMGLLGYGGIAAIAAIPNFEFVKDTLQDWTQGSRIFMQGIIYTINVALNWRGVSGVGSAIFGEDNRMTVKQTKSNVIKKLDSKLKTLKGESHKNFTGEQVELLSEGKLHEDRIPYLREITTSAIIWLPVMYSYGSTYLSAKDANSDMATDGNFGSFSNFYSITLSFMAMGIKCIFLARTKYNVTNNIFDHWMFSKEIIPVKTPLQSKLEFQWDKVGAVPWAVKYLWKAIHTVLGITSLAGGMGSVEKYLFNNANTLDTNLYSFFVTVLAAFDINFSDAIDLNETMIGLIDRTIIRFFKDDKAINEDVYGKTLEEFIKRVEINVATMSDTEVLKRGVLNNDDHTTVSQPINAGSSSDTNMNLDEQQPLLNQKFVAKWTGLVGELEHLTSKAYEEFLKEHTSAKIIPQRDWPEMVANRIFTKEEVKEARKGIVNS